MTARLEREARRVEIKHELSEIVRLALPLMAAQGGFMLMGVVDTLFLGQVSSLQMAAAALGNGVVGVIVVFNVGLGMGIEPLVSQAIGAQEIDRARAWLWQGLYLTTLVAVPVTALVLAATLGFEPVGIPHALATRATAFMYARLPGLLAVGTFATVRSYFGSIGRPRPVLYAVLLANVFNGLADYVFVFGKFGAPMLGAVGAGLATSVSSIFLALFLGLAVRQSPIVSPIGGATAGFVPPRRRDLMVIARLGWPIGLQVCAEGGIFTLVSAIIARKGEVQLAGHQVALTLASLTYMMAIGLANATTTRVGFYVGAGDSGRARRAGIVGIFVGAAFMGCCGIGYAIFRFPLAGLFTPTDADARAVAASLLEIAAAFSVFDGIQTVSAGALRGAGDTRWPFYGNMAGYWLIAPPVSLYLVLVADLGTGGYWWGLTVGLGVIAVILLWRFDVLSRRTIARVRS